VTSPCLARRSSVHLEAACERFRCFPVGDASVTANAENLLIALGGRGGDGRTLLAVPGVNGWDGGAAGNAVIIGLGATNRIHRVEDC
jgi:hypothetical protein